MHKIKENDELIVRVKEPKKSGKRILFDITSMAACTVLACSAVLLIHNMNQHKWTEGYSGIASDVGTSHEAVTSPAEASREKSASAVHEETARVYDCAKIYKIQDGKVVPSTRTVTGSNETVFNVWKSESGIGDEVKLLNVAVEDNATDTVSDLGEDPAVIHTMGDYMTYTITVTSNLENYCSTQSKELLLESLKQTMLSSFDTMPDEYHLVLSDDSGGEESVSGLVDAYEIRYNDQGQILE